jgi:D-3-phosphoglycerate dehydrogenase / 2-oxoglutarate reductase
MSWRVLVSAPYMIPVLDEFLPWFREHDIEPVVPPVEERLNEDQLLEWVKTVDGVVCGDDCFTAAVLDAAPRLRVISKWGTGIDSIDRMAAEERGVRVCNTPGAFSDPVADSVLGYMLSFARRIPWATEEMRNGSWQKIPGMALNELTLGIVGVGDVGTAVALRAKAFGMRLLGTDIREIDPDVLERTGVEMVELEPLLREADFVSLSCDLNPTSRHLMDARRLAEMKGSAIVINTSRGPVVEEQALVDALRAGRIAGAALDVFEREPLPQDSPLRSMPNVLLAPHNANSSPKAWKRVHTNTLENLLAGLRADFRPGHRKREPVS